MSSLGWSFKSALATPIAIHAAAIRHNAAKYWIRIEPHDGAHWLTNGFQGYAISSGAAQAANFESLSDATELGRKSWLVFLPPSRDGPPRARDCHPKRLRTRCSRAEGWASSALTASRDLKDDPVTCSALSLSSKPRAA